MRIIHAGEGHCYPEIPFEDDGVVFGCSHFTPGFGLERLLKAADVRGGVGLLVPPEAVCYPEPIRARMAGVLNELLPHVFVMDELSKEWMLHWGVKAEVGGHPAWLRTKQPAYDERPHTATCISEAFSFALLQLPFIIQVGGVRHVQEHPLVRWAATYEWTNRVAVDDKTVRLLLEAMEKDSDPFIFPLERIEEEKTKALETLRQLCGGDVKTAGVQALVDGILGAPTVEEGPTVGVAQAVNTLVGTSHVRKLDVGDEFDPATHYDAAYFDGAILYPQPDGTVGRYHGPARDWDGFGEAAQAFDKVLRGPCNKLEPKLRAIDIGCGAGSFVGRMVRCGWDALGFDISQTAVNQAPSHLQSRLHLADLSKPGELPTDSASLVTALDFWEHVFPEDLPALADGVKRCVTPGGLMVSVICTIAAQQKEHIYNRGVKVTKENGWVLVSGHVHLRRWGWWARWFRDRGWKVREDLAGLILVRLAEGPMQNVASWSPRNLLVLERL